MVKLEARIRLHSNLENKSIFEVAVAKEWLYQKGAFGPTEAYLILYLKQNKNGKIVEADYRGGPTQFREKTDYDKAPLVPIPDSIVKAVWTEYDGIPESVKKKLTEEQIERGVLKPWHFKPLSDEDLEYIRRNCFHPE